MLCILPLKSQSQSSKTQSYINKIEHGVYIDNYITYPYTQMSITFTNGVVVEAGMLDIPSSINIRFNNTIQNRAGKFRHLVNNLDEPVSYNGTPNNLEWYYYIGSSVDFGKYRLIPQVGVTSRTSISGKLSQYYRVLDSDGAFVDLGIHLQICDRRQFIFFGYSWGLDLN